MELIKFFALIMTTAMASPTTLPDHVRGQDLLKKVDVEIGAGAKGLVVAFLSVRCPCSNSHIPELKELVKAHPDFNFVAVHSNPDEDEGQSKAYFEHVQLPFPVLNDQTQTWANQFKALKTPHVFVVQKGGAVAFQGGMSDSKDCAKSDHKFLRDALDDLESGRKVRNPNVRTLGCAIMRNRNAK